MDIYSEIILDHFKNPRNSGRLKSKSVTVVECNPLCGDKITMDLKLDKKEKVEKVGIKTSGCAISQASASMLSGKLIRKSLEQIKKIGNEEIFSMLNIPISPARVKCALLGLAAAKRAAITYQVNNQKNADKKSKRK